MHECKCEPKHVARGCACCGLPSLASARVACWIDVMSISASHGGSGNLLFREVRHAVLGDEVVAVDLNTFLLASSVTR